VKDKLLDFVLAPFVYPAARLLKAIRSRGLHRLPRCKRALLEVGVLPVLNHYHEPLFAESALSAPLHSQRHLPGLDWNVAEQMELLQRFDYLSELRQLEAESEFRFENHTFGSGDAEYFYSLLRLKKPARLVEIGAGSSTLLARRALAQNQAELPGYHCRHVCIEPYEAPWLESLGVEVIRQRVETLGIDFFAQLAPGDVLFVDSSHVIRPQGDVLFAYLELLPTLRPGVIVHLHDIFSPRDYPSVWLLDQVRLWNEQYLLEAFLTHNRDWKIVGALSFLHHQHREALRACCPYLTPDREPGSFYIQRV